MPEQPGSKRYISVFGGSQVSRGDPLYQQAHALGRSLAEAGFGVISGGYGGTMEGVSQGAREAGESPIGVTLSTFDRWNLRANEWIATEHKAVSYLDRLRELTLRPSGFVALQGSIGTLSEVSVVWSLLQVGEMEYKPLVLLGDCWPRYLNLIQECFLSRPADLRLIDWAADVPDAVALLRQKLGAE